jgi:uncharacterized protein with ATP-grasp and redox domains
VVCLLRNEIWNHYDLQDFPCLLPITSKEFLLIAKIDCIPCILDDVRGALELLTEDEDVKHRVMKESLEFLARNMDLGREPSAYITEVHRILKRVCGIVVPFAERRSMCNELGIALGRKLEERLASLNDFERFSLLVRWSIAGNALDFRTVGTGYDFDLDEIEESLHDLAGKLDVDQLPQIYERAGAAERILFVHDNVGEIALDKLLIQELQRSGNTSVISAVRSGPITSDATMDDARQVRLHEAASSVILAGPDTLGISFEEMSEELRTELSQADLVFSKGQANYYVFSEHRDEVNCPIACLFRTKCQVVSSIFGFAGDISIAAFI